MARGARLVPCVAPKAWKGWPPRWVWSAPQAPGEHAHPRLLHFTTKRNTGEHDHRRLLISS
eukprot:1187121-Prorocentrum_minimum.AAC.6